MGILCSHKSSFQCLANKNDSGVNVTGMSLFRADCNIPKECLISVTNIVFFLPQSTAVKVHDEEQREVVIDSLLANRFKVPSSGFGLLYLHVFSLLNNVWVAIIKLYLQFLVLFCIF